MRPTPKDLTNNPDFELIFKLEHNNAKHILKEHLRHKSKIAKRYLWYQLGMAILLTSLITCGFILWYVKSTVALFFIIGAFCFSFTLLLIFHEMLHGLAFLILGFNKISFRCDIRKFVFYAQADQQVLSLHEFYICALFPLMTIKVITVVSILITIVQHSPWIWFWMIVMALHSFYCDFDIGLVSIFHNNTKKEIFRFDSKAEKSSFYYRRK